MDNQQKFRKIMKEWVIPVVLEIIVVLFFVKNVAFLIRVPTGSMIPTIDEKSWLVATRIHNPEKRVERGDIIAFYSDELGKMLIKRCIGLPGETVDIDDDGQVYIDGELLNEEYVVYHSGVSGHFEVPEGSYFFLGDNRSGSLDARFWEDPYIPAEKVYGQAHFTLWPLDNFGPLK